MTNKEDLKSLENWVAQNFEVPASSETSLENIRLLIRERITDLIEEDLDKLYQLLYRIDIDEDKLKERLKNSPLTDSSGIITDMIIERQLQKIKTRKQFG